MNIHYQHQFKQVLQDGTKIHTIRMKEYKQGTALAHIIYPYRSYRECVLSNVCQSTQKIQVDGINKKVIIDNKIINNDTIIKLAKNDGFPNIEEFWKFFRKGAEGYIIHWTNFKY